ncbi:MAG: nucleoside triphosphate pyrophosphohydrolase [Fimbriimonadaceae bacterium]|nr:nucleoside triphosphate pyrophosphohydrolase [Fimbriimonadaceae bacterium]
MDCTVACQVHVAPLLLTVDERALQVFHGFRGREVYAALAERYGKTAGIECERPFTLLGELEGLDERFEVRVAPVRDDHPGGIYGLVHIVDRLLGPGGCAWDQAQTHESLRSCMVEETYELLDAIEAGDAEAMMEELGDVLLQPVMHAQMDSRDGGPSIDTVARTVTEKLVRRHPHVFGDATAASADEVLKNWDATKRSEKGRSLLAGVSRSLPSLQRAHEIGTRASRVGFDWPSVEGVWAKLEEETEELREAWDTERVGEELGDLLFTVVNLARWAGVEPEGALRAQNDRFTARFARVEAASGGDMKGRSIEELEALWNEAKGS